MMLINAQALIHMSRKRLCFQSHAETIKVMTGIKEAILAVDYTLAQYMVPECMYRNGCYELKPCGYYESITANNKRL